MLKWDNHIVIKKLSKIFLKNVLLIFNCLFLFNYINAQDLHFSQFYNSPLSCNPANTGFMPDADYRVGGNYRSQYKNVPVPYKTTSAWGDMQINSQKLENGWFGLGIIALADQAGVGILKSNKIYGSIAYHQTIADTKLLSAGFQVGYVNKSIDVSKLTFDNQWNGKFFDYAAPIGESFAATNIHYIDLNAGINFSSFPTDVSYYNFGFSVQHINTPKETFFKSITNNGITYDNKLSRRYTAFFNGSFKLNDRVIVNPQGYYTFMENSNQLNVGGNLQYNLSGEGGQNQLITGLYYRVKDAIIPMVGIKHNTLTATFTYDATASKLAPYNSMQGGFEVSIIYTGLLNQNHTPKGMRCPSFSY